MQFNVEDVSSVKKVIHIEVPEETVRERLDDAYKELKKNAKIKGFRPGKVPRSQLERVYGKQVQADLTQQFVQESFSEVLQELQLKVVGTPQVEPPETLGKEPFRCKVTVDIMPEISDLAFKGLELKKPVYPITDGEMDAQLAMLRKRGADRKKIEEDRPAREGDFVLVDYEAKKDGEVLADIGRNENVMLEVGKNSIHKDLDENIKGMKAGESRAITVTFPEDYLNPEMAGQALTFDLTVKEIREETLPELDAEFASQFGPYESIDALKDAIRVNLQQGYEKRSEQELNEQAFSKLLEQVEFDVPEVLVEGELNRIVDDVQRSFAYHNTSMEEMGLTPEKIAEDRRETAVNQVKRQMILAKIIDQEKLDLPEEKVNQEMARMSVSIGQSLEELQKYYKETPNAIDHLKHGLLEKEAMRLIIENSDIEEVEAQPETAAETEEETN